MSSGYFPLDETEEYCGTLRNIVHNLEIVIAHYAEAIDNLTPEDAARDGRYLGYLHAAAELIRKCLRRKVLAC